MTARMPALRTSLYAALVGALALSSACRTTSNAANDASLKADESPSLPPKHAAFDAKLKSFLQNNYAAWAENYIVVAELTLCEKDIPSLNDSWKNVLQIPLSNHAYTLVGTGAVTCAYGTGTEAAKALADMRKTMLAQNFFNTALTNKIAGVLAATNDPQILTKFQAVRKGLAQIGALPFSDHEYAAAILATCGADAAKLIPFWKAMLQGGFLPAPQNAPAAARLACRYEPAQAADAVAKLNASFKAMLLRGYTNTGWIVTVAAQLAD